MPVYVVRKLRSIITGELEDIIFMASANDVRPLLPYLDQES